jgi:hypothetical protein
MSIEGATSAGGGAPSIEPTQPAIPTANKARLITVLPW